MSSIPIRVQVTPSEDQGNSQYAIVELQGQGEPRERFVRFRVNRSELYKAVRASGQNTIDGELVTRS